MLSQVGNEGTVKLRWDLANWLDDFFVNIRGQQHYLWRAVDQDGDVIDILLQLR